jgi:hypothetical protein
MVSQDCNQGIHWTAFEYAGLTGDESASMLIQVVGRIYFLEAVTKDSAFC